MTRMMLTIGLVLLVAACGDELVDPTGNWRTTITWGSGDCNLSGTSDDTMTVTRQASGDYLIADSDPDVSITGSIVCSVERCDLSASSTLDWTDTDGTRMNGVDARNFGLGSDGRITGSGSMDASNHRMDFVDE